MNTQQLAKLRSIVPEMRRVRHIHFVGIGVLAWAGIAEVLANEGYQISGSDLAPNPVNAAAGVAWGDYLFNHRPENVRDASVVGVSSASPPTTRKSLPHTKRAFGDPPCRNAGGTDAFPSRHRDCRDPR